MEPFELLPTYFQGSGLTRLYPEVAAGVWRLRVLFVNVYMVATGDGGWVLVDAAVPGYEGTIKRAAEQLFGNQPPKAVILTHGHFDHKGSLHKLLESWNVDVYAHPLEMPYLDGRSSYPPVDPLAGRGLMAWSAWIFPNKPDDFRPNLKPLPQDGSVPFMPSWRWLHTPGHAPGHVSFFRESDRTLIAGDAFITTDNESVTSVVLQKEVVSRPPAYFTPDWESARRSVRLLADLKPDVAATGHGVPFYGSQLRLQLEQLAAEFEQNIPHNSRYDKDPARASEYGTTYVPPMDKKTVATLVLMSSVAVLAVTYALFSLGKGRKNRNGEI
jgi:glyoxylase-like metal-dependent hydrolase (beta-lactamase superfamily II)